MKVTNELKKRFCKDNGLNIQLFDSPMFEDKIKMFGMEDEWKDFVKEIELYENEREFFNTYNELRNTVVDFIKSTSGYKAFIGEGYEGFFKKEDIALSKDFSNRNTYKEPNIGHRFLSIDMTKANFSCLVFYSKMSGQKLYSSYNWEEFLGQFTDNKRFLNSKCIRQSILGLLDKENKKMSAFEKVMMTKFILKGLLDNIDGLTRDNIYALRADEVIIDATNLSEDVIESVRKFAGKFDIFPVKYEDYRLYKVKDSEAYVKEFTDGSFELKRCNPIIYPVIYRFVNGIPSSDLDNYFFYEGRMAKFTEPFIPELIKGNEGVRELESDIELE